MRQKLLKHAGLARPYQFERTLVVVASFAFSAVVVVIALYLHARGQLPTGTPRAWYVAYLIALAALALALAPLPRMAAVVLSLATLEAGFGFGALALYKYHVIPSPTLTPSADDGRSTRFAWHPLLQVLPAASQNSPLTRINSERRRGREWSAEELRGKILVALFGGSTTFEGLTVEGETWADRLQAALPSNYAIANHGMDGFTSAENAIQTMFYERTKGVTPRCAIYFAGANDLRNAHIRNLDPAYADFHLPNQVDAFRIRRGDAVDAISPLVIFLGRILGTTLDTIRPAAPRGEARDSPDPAVEEAFARNVATISAINRQRGIRTIWIGVLLNRHELSTETALPWAPFVRRKDLPALVQRLNAILKREAALAGDVYVEFPPGPFERDGFRDHIHFSEAGSLLFATLLAPTILENCGAR